jgi:hypothetical protein
LERNLPTTLERKRKKISKEEEGPSAYEQEYWLAVERPKLLEEELQRFEKEKEHRRIKLPRLPPMKKPPAKK